MQRFVKSYSLLSFMLKPPCLLTQGFNNNNKAQEKLFNHMCNFGTLTEWMNVRRVGSYYLDVDIRNDQYRLVNLTPLNCITVYIMENAIGARDLNRLPQRSQNLI